jgi:hypothetical protein
VEKIERGCERDSPIPGVWEINEEYSFQKCPIKLVTVQSLEYIKAYAFYKSGYLPNPGGWIDQPEKLFEAINVIGIEIMELEEQEKLKNTTPKNQ